MIPTQSTVLDVRNLSVSYSSRAMTIPAVRKVSFHIRAAETLALVGETGCGKSTVALALLGLSAGRVEAGEIVFQGRDVATFSKKDWRTIRGKSIGTVFQDPRGSLNPVLTIGSQLVEALRTHRKISRKDARARALELLSQTGIRDPDNSLNRYPFELSGGMCQRVAVALAVCNEPLLLIADEPTSALDPTLQRQMLALLSKMKLEYGLSLLLISHDLAIISEFADRIAVMYRGSVVEHGPARAVLSKAVHPYTKALIDCLPDERARRRIRPLKVIPGVPPQPGEAPEGCVFASRCGISSPACTVQAPTGIEVSEAHWAACSAL